MEFQLVEPDKEKRSGLYAIGTTDLSSLTSFPEHFRGAADGEYPPRPGRRDFVLIGKLSDDRITSNDFFQAEDGTINGGRINLTARWVRFRGDELRRAAPRVVYVVVTLPPLAAGKYHAELGFPEYEYEGDRTKITRPPPTHPPVLPLTCDFEVLPAAATKVAPAATKAPSPRPSPEGRGRKGAGTP
jgi:hypothetical protein